MLCFDVLVNGRRLCRAGLAAGGVTVMVHWGNHPKGGAGPSRRLRGVTDLDVGGLFKPRADEDHFPKWASKRLRRGDKVTIRLVEADAADRPKRTDIEKRGWVERHRRAYYERLKKQYEAEDPKSRRSKRA